MLAVDKDAVVCDFAEVYGVLDFDGLPVGIAATLAAGLPADSRICMKMCGFNKIPESFALVEIADSLNVITHFLLGDKRQIQLLSTYMSGKQKTQSAGYDTPEAYREARQKILDRAKKRADNG